VSAPRPATGLAPLATAAALLAAAVLGAGGPLAGDDAPKAGGPPDTPRLPTVGTELVQLDAVVTGPDGRCVGGLSPSDFEIFEDGKKQTVSHFAEESRAGFRGSDERAPAGAAAAPSSATVPAAPRGRRLVVAFDDLHTTAGNLAAAKAAMSRFVDEQISPDDWVALVSTSGNVGVFQDFTRDPRALHRAIDRLVSRYVPVEPGGTPYLSEFQAELIDSNTDPEALRVAVQEILQTEDYLGDVGAREKAYAQARRMAFEIQARTGRALGALEAVVRGLAPVPGRKIVVLVSDGFLVGLGGAAEGHAFDVRRIVDAATRSGVVLYALDTRGLVADVPGGDASFRGPGVLAAPGARASLQSRGNEALKQSLNALAEDTGGFLVQNTNDLGAGLGRILRDNEVYYLLAYEPTNPARDGKFRKLQMRLAGRPDLRVRTRTGYFAPNDRRPPPEETPEARRERELGQALSSLFPLDGVPMRMSADFIDLPPAGPQAVVRARLDVSGVPFEPRADRYEADVEIAVAVYDEKGDLVGSVSGERAQLSLTEDSYRRALAQGLTLQRTVPLPPGRYQVRIAAREATRSLLGSAHAWVEIPDVASRPLTLSSVFLLADSGEGTQAAGLDDAQVDRRFGRSQGLHYVVQVYEPPPGQADVVLQAQVWRGKQLVGVTPEHPLAAGPEGRKWSERVSLAPFEPGSYELAVIVTDRTTRNRAERRIGFRVE
jgi:VWFA-related protein